MEIRDELQAKFAHMWYQKQRGILLLTPRFGKIYTSINIFNLIGGQPSILIAYPDREIKKSWEKDFITRGYDTSNVTYTTHVSLKKFVDQVFDIVVIDEIHLLSPAQRFQCSLLLMKNSIVLALTGTLMEKTEKVLYKELNLRVIAEYTIGEAILDKILPDYRITIEYVPLDDVVTGRHKKPEKTDRSQARGLTWVINKFDREGKNANFLRMNRMRLLQKSLSKTKRTVQILNESPQERILVFCGLVDIAESLGIPAYHGKTKEKEIFQDFVDGNTNKLAVVKIGNSGVTYKHLSKVLINAFDSNAENLAQKINRAMSMEYDNPGKRAEITILTSDNEVELNWLRKALEFFDKDKINYVNRK